MLWGFPRSIRGGWVYNYGDCIKQQVGLKITTGGSITTHHDISNTIHKATSAATALPTQLFGNVTSAAVLIASLSSHTCTAEDDRKDRTDLNFIINNEAIDLANVAAIALPAMISVAIGTRIGSRLSDSALKFVFGVTLAGIAPLILHKAYRETGSVSIANGATHQVAAGDSVSIELLQPAIAVEARVGNSGATTPAVASTSFLESLRSRSQLGLAGAGMGFITGLVGVGGGPIITSYLSLQTDMELTARQIVGTANLAMVPMMAAGTISHAMQGNIVWRAAAPLCLATVIGGAIGGLAAAYAPVQLLQTALAGFLVFTGWSTSRKALLTLLKR